MKNSLNIVVSLILTFAILFMFAGCNTANNKNYGMNDQGLYAVEVIPNDDEEQSGIDPNSENYGKIIENKFINTVTEPVSTFSADVDTASYSYFRKLVNNGYSLNELKSYAGSSVRTEEMINYFDYNYPAPAENKLFSTNAMISDCPWNLGCALLCLGLQASESVNTEGNNLVFLIDVSGSMNSDDKLGLLRKAFGFLVDNLNANDVISIVTYAGNERVVLEGCIGSKREKILDSINNLRSGGSTNGQAGISKAYEIAKKNYIPGGNNRIILASDGDFNVGVSSPESLKNLVLSKKNEGIYLSTMGFGTGNYKDSTMEALADNGNGVYYYIDGITEAEKVFGNDLCSTLYTVADDVKLQITFDPAYVESYRLVGYENRLLSKEDFNDDTKDAGEVGAGHSVTVCYELKLTDMAKNADSVWMKLAVRYKNPGETQSILDEYGIGEKYFTSAPSETYKFICAVTELSMLLHGSKNLGDTGIDNILSTLNSLNVSNDIYKTEFVSLVRKLAAS